MHRRCREMKVPFIGLFRLRLAMRLEKCYYIDMFYMYLFRYAERKEREKSAGSDMLIFPSGIVDVHSAEYY